ncbi:hypothetical protein BT63DRAFT_449566 [Microthyrium microscopicum]|uniref:Fe2OG dioxygenase domain-containing protein n=1 Tax=Microthyrium microscopicum TaxID=703497 RepID=A0A6A6UT20_9PEZI|nr:hypothetical protein BT63DRAFT_449566 [Microthyrium microscopicum]
MSQTQLPLPEGELSEGKIFEAALRLEDSREEGRGLKVTFPLDEPDRVGNHNYDAFYQLLADCQPATLGRGIEGVLDEEYRKAGKMDVEDFCTNFNLSNNKIMHTVAQALARGGPPRNYHAAHDGVRAELYKLNVYSGPSGKFKPHVDTPRSGALVVRHTGREVHFDWSNTDSKFIQWAAFFSDCEHEVFEVTEGHRLTLTYNFHWTKYAPSLMATHMDAFDQSSLHLYSALEKLIQCPTFLPNRLALRYQRYV